MSQENVEVVRRAYDRFNQTAERRHGSNLDLSWFAELATPEFEYVAGLDFPGLPGGVHGIDDFVRFLDGFWGIFEEARTDVVELIDAGDAVLAIVRFHGKGTQSGATVEMTAFQLWSFIEGKLASGRGFPTREEALEAAGLTE